jgi:small GTP-binding protein
MRFVFKVTIIGDGGVGKTSLIKKYSQGEFQEEYISTIGAQFSIYDHKIEDDEIKLFFWDIAGQDDFHVIRSSFYEESKATIIVYSLEQNDRGSESIKNVLKWYNDIIQYCKDIPIIVFANKVDLAEKLEMESKDYAKLKDYKNYLGTYKTSAKTGEGVDSAFKKIIETLYSLSKDG